MTVQDTVVRYSSAKAIARISERWFGDRPGPDQAENIVFPGYGPPDMPGHDATPQNPNCG